MPILKQLLLLLAGVALALLSFAQRSNQTLGLARQFVETGELDKALPLLKRLYDEAPFDQNRYQEYLDVLLQAEQFDTAHSLVQYMAKIRRNDPVMDIDRGRVFEAQGQQKAAKKYYQAATEQPLADELVPKRMAAAFERLDHLEYAVATYERARKQWHNPYLFATELALLYGKLGATERAIEALLDVAMSQSSALEQVKSSMLSVIDTKKQGLQLLQKSLNKRLLQVPDNPALNELNSWIYIRKNDYQGALKQLIDLDKKLEENGQRILYFGQQAALDDQYPIALKSFEYILKNGVDHPLYAAAFEAKLSVWRRQIESTRPIDQQLVAKLAQGYAELLNLHPQYYSQSLIRDYGRLIALYQHQADSAISLLESAINRPGMRKGLQGQIKLDMGDYEVISGNVWEASLLYSQVDKAFKEDLLGEEARFRNAKLAYYRGDFEWAQAQLSVLKASTTELIANDALYLSVLITENTDSNQVPLLRFAAADLLLFQHHFAASDSLLDSITQDFPQTPLLDDIYLQRAKIAIENGRFADAIKFLTTILEQHGDDVLGDDATYRLALLYEEQLNDNQLAKRYLEQIILDYPGSTYVQAARLKLVALNKEKSAESINP